MLKSFLLCSLVFATIATAAPPKVVLIAGVKTHGPAVHEYLKSVKLLKVLLDSSTNVKSEVHFNGWPRDPRTLETASTIVVISDGQPSDRLPPMPLLTPERVALLDRQMRRGCGLVVLHYSTFVTYAFADRALAWQGGYYEWKARDGVTSAIKTLEADLAFPTPNHPILQGLAPFRLKDEFYYRLRLHPDHTPLLRVPTLPGSPADQTVGWALDRPDGGRAFATSTGHFFANWQNDSYRKLILNAILWTAHHPVPPTGVASTYVDEAEVNRRLAQPAAHALIVAPPAEAEALRQILDSEIPRFRLTVTTPAEFPRLKLRRYDLLLLHGRHDVPAHYTGGIVYTALGVTPTDDHITSPNPLVQPFDTKADLTGPLPAGELLAASAAGPVAVAVASGKRRVAHIALGRDAVHLLDPGVTQLILYASLWATHAFHEQP